eukprot:scaffold21635_cov15-Tisochrysis_lutea.AAC.3
MQGSIEAGSGKASSEAQMRVCVCDLGHAAPADHHNSIPPRFKYYKIASANLRCVVRRPGWCATCCVRYAGKGGVCNLLCGVQAAVFVVCRQGQYVQSAVWCADCCVCGVQARAVCANCCVVCKLLCLWCASKGGVCKLMCGAQARVATITRDLGSREQSAGAVSVAAVLAPQAALMPSSSSKDSSCSRAGTRPPAALDAPGN